MSPSFLNRVQTAGKKQLLVCGVEAHVCIYQTVCGLLNEGYEVHVALGAVSSRVALNRQVAINKMERLGAHITTTEIALFELMKEADTKLFRSFITIVK